MDFVFLDGERIFVSPTELNDLREVTQSRRLTNADLFLSRGGEVTFKGIPDQTARDILSAIEEARPSDNLRALAKAIRAEYVMDDPRWS